MSVVQFVIGLAALAVGLICVTRRRAIVARHERRPHVRAVQAPEAYLVLGIILVLVGVSQLIAAFV